MSKRPDKTQQALANQVQERARELETMLEISRYLASTLELDELLPVIFQQLKRVVECNGISVSLLEEEGTFLLLDYLIPGLESTLPKRWRAGENEGWLEENLHQLREPVIIPDVLADTVEATTWRENAKRTGRGLAGVRSWMAVPLVAGDRPVGMLTVEHEQPDFYNAHHARLALAVANHVAVAIENARLYEQAQELAALRERQKLARELHDSVSQALYGIGLGAQTAIQVLPADPAQREVLLPPLEYVHSLATAALAEMRALIFELRPESLAVEGLIPALTRRLEATRVRHGIEVDAKLEIEPDLPLASKEVLYRVAQEALHNVVKHAEARRVDVSLTTENGDIVLKVRDDGRGFDPEGNFPGHLGLRSMRERVQDAGGQLLVESTPGEGATVRAVLPSGANDPPAPT